MIAALVFGTARAARLGDGARMDQPVPKKAGNGPRLLIAAAVILCGAVLCWLLVPHGRKVMRSDIRLATAEVALFRDEVAVRATVTPLHAVMLDALESGRVEEIRALDGAAVKKGDVLFRLFNPQLQLDLVAREADRAQQISNLSLLRSELESSRTAHRRRVLELEFALEQARRQQERFTPLMRSGAIAAVTLQDSQDRVTQQHRLLEEEDASAAVEARTKTDGIGQMQQALLQLDEGMRVVNESIAALSVRAPIDGRLTDFHLQPGEIVKSGQRIGRIDDPSEFKLVAQIDEYFLGRVSARKQGEARIDEHDFPVEVERVFPQISDGRFSADLLFKGAAPGELKPGQSVETRITLAEKNRALVLPNDAFLNESGGAWVFVLSPDGTAAERRNIRVGRRNDAQVEVESGLAPGERVIVSSYTAFGHETRLRLER